MDEAWFRITVQGGYVRAYHARSARDEDEVREVLAAIDAVLGETSIDLLMFDSRDADRTPPEVAAVIWSWLQKRVAIRKVATLMHSHGLSRNVRRASAQGGVRLKTFEDEEQARLWLYER
jgi:hypothetical protein